MGTKKCKRCQTEISDKATKCPQCNSDLRPWFRRHPILTAILVLIVIGIIGAVAAESSNTTQKVGENSTAGQSSTTTTTAATTQNTVYHVGDQVKSGDF